MRSSIQANFRRADADLFSAGVNIKFMISHFCALCLFAGWIGQFLQWKALVPLSRLTFLTYLLHPLVMWYKNGNLRERVFLRHFPEMVSCSEILFVNLFGRRTMAR